MNSVNNTRPKRSCRTVSKKKAATPAAKKTTNECTTKKKSNSGVTTQKSRSANGRKGSRKAPQDPSASKPPPLPPPPEEITVVNDTEPMDYVSRVDFTSAASVSKFLESNSFKFVDNDQSNQMNSFLNSLNSSSVEYIKNAMSSVNNFFNTLSKHESVHNLADRVLDPESGKYQYQLILLTRGIKDAAKFNVLNKAFLVVSLEWCKLKKMMHVDLLKR